MAAAGQAGAQHQQQLSVNSEGDQEQQASPSALVRSEAAVNVHTAEAWRLLQVLFEHIEGEDDESHPPEDEAGPLDEQTQEAEQSAWFKSRPYLAGFKRRAAFSRWLAAVVKPKVEEELKALASGGSSTGSISSRGQQQQQGALVPVASSSPRLPAGSSGAKGGQLLWAVLQLLSGHQRGGAVALAAAAGDVRLATLLAAGGAAAVAGSKELAEQIKVGHSSLKSAPRICFTAFMVLALSIAGLWVLCFFDLLVTVGTTQRHACFLYPFY
jgi:hypothetical protein